MAFYMKSVGGNVFKRVKTEAKRQELLAAGWTDADAPIEATEGKQEGSAPPEKETPAQGADAPIEEETAAENAEQESTAPPEERPARNTGRRRASSKPKSETVTG